MHSLSDPEKTPLKRIRETFDLPKGRESVLAEIGRLLNLGKVQKLTVEIGKPIKLERFVPEAMAPPTEPPEPLEEDWMNTIRSSDLQDFPTQGKPPLMYLLHAFALLSQKELKAKALVVHAIGELRDWLGVDAFVELNELFGVEVAVHPQIPEDTATLIALDPQDAEGQAFVMRIVFDKEKKNEANRREGAEKRNRGQGPGGAPREVGKPS